MSEKYIRENKNSFIVTKNSRIYAKVQSLDDAIYIRDLLVKYDWKLELFDGLYQNNILFKVIDEKIVILGVFESKPSKSQIDKLTRQKIRNPNNSKYGLNISRVFDTFVIKKQIAGDEYIFGYYDNQADAEFVRNFLMDHMWDVNQFSQVEFDEETYAYKVVELIDDKVYVLDSYLNESDVDLDECHKKFLKKITNHKSRIEIHSYLDGLTDRIHDLEERFEVKADDANKLNEVIFSLTPWQKIVYDSVDMQKTFDEIKTSLVRYRSKNFDEKIQRNLDELVDMGLISKNQDKYEKTNF